MSNLIPLTLQWFPKEDDYLVGEETYCIELDQALEIVETDKNYDPVFAYGYKVDKNISEKIQTYYKHSINLGMFEYFLCSYSNRTCPNNGK